MAKRAKKAAKQASGGARLMIAGKRPVLLGLTPEQWDRAKEAADRDGRKVAPFFAHHGMLAAEEILRKKGDTH